MSVVFLALEAEWSEVNILSPAISLRKVVVFRVASYIILTCMISSNAISDFLFFGAQLGVPLPTLGDSASLD